MSILEVLSSKRDAVYTIFEGASVDSAISHLVEQQLSSSLAVDASGQISGIFTARDILRFLHRNNKQHGAMADHMRATAVVRDLMAPKDQLVYCSPDDTVRRCREIMFQVKIRNIPVIENGRCLGIVNIKDLADSAFSVAEIGGKKGFIRNIAGRKGLPEGVRMDGHLASSMDAADSADGSSSSGGGSSVGKLEVSMGAFALPHPFKQPLGVAANRRQYGADDLCTDMSLCEDAHFALSVSGRSPQSPRLSYLCVADGVGSWRQYGVDPRLFAHKLVENARKVVELDSWNRESMAAYPEKLGGLFVDQEPIHPLDIISDAYTMTAQDDAVVGSSTLCLAAIDTEVVHGPGSHNSQAQLFYSNIGDCGLMVLRHIDSDVAGYMRLRQLPKHLGTKDLHIAYLSQQQLKSFNRPYQLGFSNLNGTESSFQSPAEADTASIPLMEGDIVLLASDGIFDNLELNEIVAEVAAWEKKWLPRSPSVSGDQAMQALAEVVVRRARELSLDKDRDSPFAVLAKENDIMWGGGMPDDTTVVVARLERSSSS